tara:strand:- start:137 stop:313 length:177 start_codon:yes stop_codon:yes gene_type:complete
MRKNLFFLSATVSALATVNIILNKEIRVAQEQLEKGVRREQLQIHAERLLDEQRRNAT